MTNFKNVRKGIETDIKSIHGKFNIEPSKTKKHKQNIKLNKPVDTMKVPKEQRDKLESYIQQWENPSKWYECRKKGLEWFLMVAEKNSVSPEEVEYVIEKNGEKQPILKPIIKDIKTLQREDLPNIDDMDRLRKFLKQYPMYNKRIENGENVADIAISIIKRYKEEEEIRKLDLDN